MYVCVNTLTHVKIWGKTGRGNCGICLSYGPNESFESGIDVGLLVLFYLFNGSLSLTVATT